MGSRYVVSSPCDRLGLIEQSDKPCVFIGKPCDVAAVSMLRKRNPRLDSKLGLVLTFFCAGTPSVKGTLDLLDEFNISLDNISSLKYRGDGWPGGFSVLSNEGNRKKLLGYMDCWHFLQKYRSFRCNLCPDGLGELADISCGDAWHRYSDDEEDVGRSLIIARSKHGKRILERAASAGYLKCIDASPSDVIRAQGFVGRRKEIFGRQLAMKLLLDIICLNAGRKLP